MGRGEIMENPKEDDDKDKREMESGPTVIAEFSFGVGVVHHSD